MNTLILWTSQIEFCIVSGEAVVTSLVVCGVQVRSLLDAKYKTDNKITELKSKCASLEKELEEMTQVCPLAKREQA